MAIEKCSDTQLRTPIGWSHSPASGSPLPLSQPPVSVPTIDTLVAFDPHTQLIGQSLLPITAPNGGEMAAHSIP